jgi:hypothetical protein
MTSTPGRHPDPAGRDGRRKRRVWPWLLAVGLVLVVALGGVAAYLVTDGFGQHTASDGDTEFALNWFKTAGVQDHPPPHGMYVLATVTITNNGGASESLPIGSQTVLDAQGHRYPAISGQVIPADHDSTTSLTVDPGARQAVLRFDVPKDADLTALEFHASANSAGVTITL